MLASGMLFTLVTLVIVCTAILLGINEARKGKQPQIRPLAALQAIDEAIGRATEMGRPVHFSAGVGNLTVRGAPVMMASLSFLSYIAEKSARMDCSLIVTVAQGDVYAASDEVVRGAFLRAGKPELYQPGVVRYLSADQYVYAGGIVGIINRENVAVNIMIGHYANEALFIAEEAHHAGCMQIAGTTNEYQIPFFVAACDYVLLGEEVFAAGAQLSQEPSELGAITGQDFVKLFALILVLLGSISATFGSSFISRLINK
ncbi:MAG TPA: hypothetical protein GXX30_02465 [Firmicutes bacterium]|nr:hypothetical protein [Candidatus Fermentithermobacillaceae bacterium]